MATAIRHASPADYGRVIQHVNAWWGGREMAPMLPKLFFLHFEGTSFVAEDDEGKLVAFLIGFLSQTDSDEAYIHFVGVAPSERGLGDRPGALRAVLRRGRAARPDAHPVRDLAGERGLDRLSPVARLRRRARRRRLRRAGRGPRAVRQAAELTVFKRSSRPLGYRQPDAGHLRLVGPEAAAAARGGDPSFSPPSARSLLSSCSRSAPSRSHERDTIPARTTVAGVDVGGKSYDQAAAAVLPATRHRDRPPDQAHRPRRLAAGQRTGARRAAARRSGARGGVCRGMDHAPPATIRARRGATDPARLPPRPRSCRRAREPAR